MKAKGVMQLTRRERLVELLEQQAIKLDDEQAKVALWQHLATVADKEELETFLAYVKANTRLRVPDEMLTWCRSGLDRFPRPFDRLPQDAQEKFPQLYAAFLEKGWRVDWRARLVLRLAETCKDRMPLEKILQTLNDLIRQRDESTDKTKRVVLETEEQCQRCLMQVGSRTAIAVHKFILGGAECHQEGSLLVFEWPTST